MTNGQVGDRGDREDGMDSIIEELNAVRSREIISKAVSGVLLILLKWYKTSRQFCFIPSVACMAWLTVHRYTQI